MALNVKDGSLRADIRAQLASLAAAKAELSYTSIIAPVDGKVGERHVFPGQLVSPGVEVIPLVEGDFWIEANFRETQLGNMRTGDRVDIAIDAIPDAFLHGKVDEISPSSGSQLSLLPPDNATGNFTKVVQRIPVKISFDSVSSYGSAASWFLCRCNRSQVRRLRAP